VSAHETRYRRIYFDCDVYDAAGQKLDGYCSCLTAAPETSDFEAWAEIVGKETTSALLTDRGPTGASIRLDVKFTHFFFLSLDRNAQTAAKGESEPYIFPRNWTPQTSDLYTAYFRSLETLGTEGSCSFGHYPWDYWQRTALQQGLREDVAQAGRDVMRESYQHNWNDAYQEICGWKDAGVKMMDLGLRSPERALKRWNWLLETDGERVDPENKAWIEGSVQIRSQLRRKFYKRPAVTGA